MTWRNRRGTGLLAVLLLSLGSIPFRHCSALSVVAPPELTSLPLPVKLAGGLFLFASSVSKSDQDMCQALKERAQTVLNQDALIQMELGTGLELGGVFACTSSSSRMDDDDNNRTKSMILECQVNGGNSWAQARIYGTSSSDDDDGSSVRLLSLEIANMDASLNGGWAQVSIPPPDKIESSEELLDDQA